MKNFYSYIIIVAISIVGYSCSDLDEEIRGDFTESFDPNNPNFNQSENVNGTLPDDGMNAAFSRLLTGTANHGSYFSVSEVSTDEVVITQKGGDWFDGGIWLNMHRHIFNATHPGLNQAWVDNYSGITQTNELLAAGGLNDNQVAQLKGIRAYYYWRLMDMFGRIRLITTPDETPGQSERLDAFNFIESELLDIIPDLGDARVYGRFNVYAAHALLSRLYLNAEIYTGSARYQEAIDHADEVINSGLYDLSPVYGDAFSPANVDNIEHILVAVFDEATGTGMNFAQMTLHYPSQLTYRLQQQPWNGYSTLEEFYNSYDDADERKVSNFIVGPQFDLNGNPILDVAFDPADPDGAAINYTPEINQLAPSGSRQAGARMGKFSFKLGQLPAMDNDYPLLRYGEVLMNKAEALARLNGFGDASALAIVNDVRARSNAPSLASMDEESLLAERGREFFQEALRRTDLIRFGAWGNAWWEKESHSDAFKNLMPIPLTQINASTDLTQNEGY